MSAVFRVRDAMASPNVVTVRSDANLRELRAIFTRYDANVLPVVARDQRGRMRRLAGVVTRADLVGLLIGARSERVRDRRLRTHVGMIVRDAVPLSPGSSVAAAAARLLEERLEALPVADAEGGIVGMLSLDDILEFERRPLSGAR